MSILEIKNLCHVYDSKQLFNNANLVVNNGEHIGVVGLNGAGKSTFINIIANKISYDGGEVKWLSGVRWGYLDQYATAIGNQTVMQYLEDAFLHLFELSDRLEKLYSDMSGVTDEDELNKMVLRSSRMEETLVREHFYDIEAQIKKVANGIGINNLGYDTSVSTLSGGQRVKVMLCKLLLEENDIMLLDEPTNFLDVEHVEWLTKYLISVKKTFLVISHDTEFLNKIATSIVNIENGTIKKYSGNYKQFLAQREMNAKQYEDEYVRQQAEIKRLTDYIERNKARASTANMANARKKKLDKMDILQKPQTIMEASFSFPYIEVFSKDFLVVDRLSIGYDFPLLPPISFRMTSSSKLWIRGTNGIGKTTLLRTILRRIKSFGGFCNFHIAAKPAYLEQEFEFERPEMNAYGYFAEKFPKFNPKEIRSELAKVGIKGELALRQISNLSGGERVRIKLAVLCNTPSNILLLDEPTNHLDVLAKEKLKEAIKEYPGAVILVTHEKDFAEDLCTEILDVKV